MEEKGVDAIVIDGFGPYDPNVFYMLTIHHLNGIIIKKRNEEAFLVHGIMERDEAKKTGLRLVEMTKYEYNKIQEKQKDRIKAWAMLLERILRDLGVKGRVCFYGNKAVGSAYYLVKALLRLMREIKIVHEPTKTIMLEARETKDEHEVNRIRAVAAKTEDAVAGLVEFLKKHRVRENHLVKEDGTPFRIADAKQFLSRGLLESGLIEISGTILSIGRDAGVPHSMGNDDDILELGKTIILDVFPRELVGGYYYDFTRTFVLGQASKEIADAYALVAEGQEMLTKAFKTGTPARKYEQRLCKLFEKHGHPTPLSSPNTKSGYIHSLGHGLGLEIHERPFFGLAKTNKDRIEPGALFTVEPGLYYPEKGFGIRLEDVVYVTAQGSIENLSKFPKELVIEVQ